MLIAPRRSWGQTPDIFVFVSLSFVPYSIDFLEAILKEAARWLPLCQSHRGPVWTSAKHLTNLTASLMAVLDLECTAKASDFDIDTTGLVAETLNWSCPVWIFIYIWD